MLQTFNQERVVIKALGKMLKDETDYNVIIYVGEEPDFKEFRAHSSFLRNRSDCFDKMFSAEDVQKDGEKYIIKKPNINPQAFQAILE